MANATEPSKIQIPVIHGSPTKWLDFVVKFKDLVHDLQFLINTQRMAYILQHLEGEAKRAVQCFSNDKVGYIMALKRLKYLSETSDMPGIHTEDDQREANWK